MSDMTTLARPYARAVFEFAHDANQLSEWSAVLQALSMAAVDELFAAFIANPMTTVQQHLDVLRPIIAKQSLPSQQQFVENFIAALAQNKRLPLLPDIFVQYEALRAEQEKTLVVRVACFSAPSALQQRDLVNSLSTRLKRQVTLDICIDKSLLGGAIIAAGDLVIDGSVQSKLNKLGASLAA